MVLTFTMPALSQERICRLELMNEARSNYVSAATNKRTLWSKPSMVYNVDPSFTFHTRIVWSPEHERRTLFSVLKEMSCLLYTSDAADEL